jgi:hypothetical protein
MPKVKISEYSATANSNTDVASINIDEGCAPSGINNAIRAVMGHLKDFQQGTYGDPFNGPVNGTLGATTASTAVVTTLTTSSTVTHNGGTANGVAYLNGSKVLTTGSALTFSGTVLSVVGGGYTDSIGGGAVQSADGTRTIGLTANFTSSTPGIYSSGANPIAFYINSTERARIDSSGNVGLGSTSISAVGSYRVLDLNNTSGGYVSLSAAGTRVGAVYGASTAVGLEAIGATNIIQFLTNGAERARIDSSGNLLVGTTDANPNSGDGVKMNAGTGARTSIVGAADTNANFAITVYSRSPSAYRFQVGWGGTIYATSTSITAISDASLKTNVRGLETGLTEVMALQPRRFDWINGDASNVAGFIAQEVQQVLPDLVENYQYSDEETKLGLKMGDILPTLVKAIQEQQALITTLTARITALESA